VTRDPRAALPKLAARPFPFLLQSAAPGGRFGRFSFAGADPFLTLSTKGDRIEIARSGEVEVLGGDPFEALRTLLDEHHLPGARLPTPLPSGAVGFLSYDLGRRIERIPDGTEDELELPDLCLSFYDAVATFDHETGEAFVVSSGLPERGDAARARAEARAEDLVELLRPGAGGHSHLPPVLSPLRSTFGRDEYVAAVRIAKERIAAGDIFQVNVSQRFLTETAEPGTVIYERLVRANPAPFAAYLVSTCGAEVLSASPERFLRVDGRAVEACPIKGTRRRSPDREEDRALARELLSSEKDRAELVMIVDLVRNDLGRVAEFGSVRVEELAALTSHPTVHHLNGSVTARLAEGRDVVDLLRASFPCGSITGAPKVRAMEIIEELEPVRRGVYTGAVGYLSFTGEADLSVSIRTMVKKDGRVAFSVGGGIVADSDPLAEYEETLDKGRGLAAALGFSL